METTNFEGYCKLEFTLTKSQALELLTSAIRNQDGNLDAVPLIHHLMTGRLEAAMLLALKRANYGLLIAMLFDTNPAEPEVRINYNFVNGEVEDDDIIDNNDDYEMAV